MEFWPYGLRRAGGLELAEQLVAEHYVRIVDMHPYDDYVEVMPASAIGSLVHRLTGTVHTDLVLLPG